MVAEKTLSVFIVVERMYHYQHLQQLMHHETQANRDRHVPQGQELHQERSRENGRVGARDDAHDMLAMDVKRERQATIVDGRGTQSLFRR